ncbi:MAG TPA: TIGR00730 family Rossman fold protein [Phycisphaerae bacterium]
MMLTDRGVTVFCSSSNAVAPVYRAAAAELGRVLVARGAVIVYGGGSVGLMGVLADAGLAAGGRVVGVIPRQLVAAEIAHAGLTEQIVVETMHERKAIMSERAAGYVILPGGFGTYEEFFEVVTWKQLGMHDKPIVLLNVEGFFDPLLGQIERAVAERMIKPEYAGLIAVRRTVEQVIGYLEAYEPVPMREQKWF